MADVLTRLHREAHKTPSVLRISAEEVAPLVELLLGGGNRYALFHGEDCDALGMNIREGRVRLFGFPLKVGN